MTHLALARKAFLSTLFCYSFFLQSGLADPRNENTLNAEQAYEHAQNIRSKAEALWRAEGANNQQIRQGIQLLKSELDFLRQPRRYELAKGNIYLKARPLDINRDIAEAYVKLKDLENVLMYLNRSSEFGVSDWFLNYLEKDALYQKYRSDKRFQRFINRVRARLSVTHNEIANTPFKTNLSASQKIAGLSLYWSLVRDYFVYFDQVPNLDWDKTYLDLLPKVIATKSTDEYYRIMSHLAAQLGDGHTNIYYPEELSDLHYARPPFRTALIDDQVIVTHVFSPTLEKKGVKPGLIVKKIDGVASKRYAQKNIAPWVSSSTPQDHQLRTYSYELFLGARDKSVTVTFENVDGQSFKLSIPRKGYGDNRPRSKSHFKMIGNIAYLDITQFENDDGVNLLVKNLQKIQSSDGLIIDVRTNGGGNSGWNVLSYLTDRAFHTTASRYRIHRGYFRARNNGGDEWSLPEVDLIDPKATPFLGKVIVLTSAQTFSAAEDFTAVFKQMKRGKIIGQASGGSTGQPMFFKLPGGGYARFCAKRDTLEDGSEFVGIGIKPDVSISPKLSDVINNTDPVLAKAMEFLESNK